MPPAFFWLPTPLMCVLTVIVLGSLLMFPLRVWVCFNTENYQISDDVIHLASLNLALVSCPVICVFCSSKASDGVIILADTAGSLVKNGFGLMFPIFVDKIAHKTDCGVILILCYADLRHFSL